MNGVATLVVAVAPAFLVGTANATRERPFQTIRELRGISALRVEVDGLPDLLDRVRVSISVLVTEEIVSARVDAERAHDRGGRSAFRAGPRDRRIAREESHRDPACGPAPRAEANARSTGVPIASSRRAA